MKVFFSIFIALSILLTYSNTTFAQSQKKEQNEDDKFKDESVEKLKFFKEKYDTVYDAPFDIVYKATKKSIEELNCLVSKSTFSQTETGFYKGLIRSDYCVFSDGKDTTFEVLNKYSLNMPSVRGGRWDNGRSQYKFTILELPDGKVSLELKGDVSGYESYATNQYHFWRSNGILETRMMANVRKKIVEFMK